MTLSPQWDSETWTFIQRFREIRNSVIPLSCKARFFNIFLSLSDGSPKEIVWTGSNWLWSLQARQACGCNIGYKVVVCSYEIWSPQSTLKFAVIIAQNAKDDSYTLTMRPIAMAGNGVKSERLCEIGFREIASKRHLVRELEARKNPEYKWETFQTQIW